MHPKRPLIDTVQRAGATLKLITSYLIDRRQKVRIQEYKSEYKEITTGVPQGTKLEPLLFKLYINDFLGGMQKDTIMSYADDTVIISSDNTWSSAQEKMSTYLNHVAKWLAQNKFSLNVDKTVYMTLGNYCDSVPSTLNIKIGT